MFKLLQSVFKRITVAVTSPFRMIIVRIQRMFNINVITAKLIAPLTKKVKSLITLKPQAKEDYYVIGKHWVYKKLFLALILVACAGVLIYFSMIAPLQPAPPANAAVTTKVSYNYDDMKLPEFTGVANIRAADGKVIYTGDVNKGVCSGNGTLYDHNGKLVYAGGFAQNKYNGKGVSYYPSGKIKYEGEFVDNLCQGAGSLYSTEEVLVYTGGFLGGVYAGAGKAYSDQGELLYEGGFADGKYHGDGTLYYSDGTMQYQGTFFQGMMQGKGSIYDKTGKLLYTGDVANNAINYRSLVHSTLADIEAAFAESPRIFYTDTDSAFVYEQAGVIVTVDCRMLVDIWKKPETAQNNGDSYYMPEANAQASSSSAPTPPPNSSSESSEPVSSQMSLNTKMSAKIGKLAIGGERQPLTIKPMAWYVADGTDTSSGQSSQPPQSSSSSGSSTVPNTSGSLEITVTTPNPEEKKPEFMQQTNTLYFEIDKNVWQSEADLDKTKVQIKKITVFNNKIASPTKDMVEFSDNIPPSMEDCVAIDFIRQQLPTAFSQVIFEMDNQNRLFVKLANINFAAQIRSRAYLAENLTYRYCYPATGESPLFFSIQR